MLLLCMILDSPFQVGILLYYSSSTLERQCRDDDMLHSYSNTKMPIKNICAIGVRR